jgi:hypothetical protein
LTEIVYVLTNPAFPHLAKTGLTRGRVRARAQQLFSTGVPSPFEIAFAARVENCRAAESAVHRALGQECVHMRREFFAVGSVVAIGKRQPFTLDDLTEAERGASLSAADRQHAASEEAQEEGTLTLYTPEAAALLQGLQSEPVRRRRAPDIDFFAMGLKPGDLITSAWGPTAQVADRRKVLMDGETMPLGKATARASNGRVAHSYTTPYWAAGGDFAAATLFMVDRRTDDGTGLAISGRVRGNPMPTAIMMPVWGFAF